ncbi:FixH family protein [Fodinibius salsisoli]|uniref:FixH family protein n=1 Tax=Fodinibius salsisoli TaxID=2820877 RepID=A0ABT3PNG2_9BACT|nr:FixH family protein [Fodinibius salsisoli]MCW9707289.1 FixH family protein [Fodinibius salsisoli]
MNTESEQKKSGGFSWNWGNGIALVIILFICTTMGVVGYLISLDFYVVSDNYYEKAEEYQQHIERIQHTSAMDQPVEIMLSDDKQNVTIQFPTDTNSQETDGKIQLYRPNDSSLDHTVKLTLNDQHRQSISTANLMKGKWVIKVSWTIDQKGYYKQKNIFL